MWWLVHRRSVDVLDQPSAGQAVDAGEIRAGEHAQHSGGGLRPCGVDTPDRRVRMGRSKEIRMGGVWNGDVARVLARAREEANVFFATDGLSDQAGSHDRFS